MLAGSLMGTDDGWLLNYRKGVSEREKGGCSAAAFYFLEALKEHPAPQASVKLDAVATVDYMPRLLLADCLCRMGERDLAAKYMDEAAAEKELKTAASVEMTASVERCLAGRPPAVSGKRREVLEQVQARCGLAEDKVKTLYPWYFDYEVSQEFLKMGEYEAGVQYLYRALDKKTTPQERVRLYGMWFSDYHPYFLLAQAFYHMGSYACAEEALGQSLKQEDLPDSSPEQRERDRMLKDLEEIPTPRR